jgi:predicted dehydrogenase
MADELRIAIIGLDTSHSIEFTRRMQAPDCPDDQRVAGMRAVKCLRFETPFQDQQGLDQRQAQMQAWGVQVTADFDEAVADCDAFLVEINDPQHHLDYFTRIAGLGKPVFLDKPLADTIENGRKICALAADHELRFFSASSLRFVPSLTQACEAVPEPLCAIVYGPLGLAPAGSSIVWYGVHAFEMLQRAMGRGAQTLSTRKDGVGVVVTVDYANGNRGIVELTEGAYIYGGCLRTTATAAPFVVDMHRAYTDQLVEIERFLQGAEPPMEVEDTLEVMAMLDAAERALHSGVRETV